MQIERVIKKFLEFHDKAKKNDYIIKPVSWALYQTWKWSDEKEKPRKDKNER